MSGPAGGAPDARPGLLERLALHRPELRAWALYDWANSAMVTTVVAAVFPIFFSQVAAEGLPPEVATRRFALVTTISLAAIAIVSPLLGAYADFTGTKKRMLAAFLFLGSLATGAMFAIGTGQWLLASVLFGLANIGAAGSFVFYDSLLPHVARPGEMDRLSTTGYALGYLGGGLVLALQLAWIQRPDLFGLPHGEGLSPDAASLPARLAFLSVAIWWVGFSIPLLRRVPEPPRRVEDDEVPGQRPLVVAFTRLGETFRELRRTRHAALLLVAFLLYNDGITTIMRMATIYGQELQIGHGVLIGAILMVQFVGIPFSIGFGVLARWIGPKRSILLAIGVYLVVSLIARNLEDGRDFLALAFLVGMVQGGCQALSRSLFASMIPRYKSAELFGLFAVLEKFAGILGPALFYLAHVRFGSSRAAISSVVVFFLLGAVLLLFVDVEAGRRAAREAEARAHAVRDGGA